MNPEVRGGSPWGSLLRVFWEPGATLAYVAERRPVLAPYLVLSLVTAAMTFYVTTVTMDAQIAFTRETIAAQGADGADMESILALSRTVGVITAVGGGLLGPWFSGLILTLVLLLFGAMSGGARPFRAYFSVAGYALLPGALGGLIESLLRARATDLTAMSRITLSAAALAPDSTGAALAFLQTLHPTALWVIFLAMTGFAAVHGFRLRRAVGLGVGVWVLSFILALMATGLQSLTNLGG